MWVVTLIVKKTMEIEKGKTFECKDKITFKFDDFDSMTSFISYAVRTVVGDLEINLVYKEGEE